MEEVKKTEEHDMKGLRKYSILSLIGAIISAGFAGPAAFFAELFGSIIGVGILGSIFGLIGMIFKSKFIKTLDLTYEVFFWIKIVVSVLIWGAILLA